MSKSELSDMSRINITDPIDVMESKIMKAKTDSILEVYKITITPTTNNGTSVI